MDRLLAVGKESLTRAVGLAPPRTPARLLVLVEDRGAEEEQRREHDRGEHRSEALGLVGELAQRERDHPLADDREDGERREAAEDVDVVGPRELDRARERPADRQRLDQRDGDDQPDEREPDERGRISTRARNGTGGRKTSTPAT